MLLDKVVHFVARLGALGAVLAVLVGAPFAHAQRTGAVAVSTFYASTKQAYDNWPKTHYAAPPHVSDFPAGTTYLAFYFAYSGATKSSGFYVVIRTHDGPTYNVGGWYKLAAGSNSQMIWIRGPDGAFPNGLYDVDLVIDSHRLETITLNVGGAGGTGNNGNGGSNGNNTGGVTISAFYSITPAAAKGWLHVNQPPAKTVAFPAGTSQVDFAFLYKGATAKVTTGEIIVTGSGGLKLTDQGGTFKLPYASGGEWSPVLAPQHLAFPNGTYTAELLIDGQSAGQEQFTVGASASGLGTKD